MLTELHTTLQQVLYQRGGIPEDEVDIRFEMPTKQWIDSLTHPTINLYLFGVEENFELRQTANQVSRGNGQAQYRMPPRRFDLRYMVSVLTTVVQDEHLLLWRTLATLLRHPELPTELMPEPLRAVSPLPVAQVSKADDGPNLLDLWSAFESSPHPSLYYVVTMPVNLDLVHESPLVLTRTTRFAHHASSAPYEQAIRIGGVVRGADHEPLSAVAVDVVGSAESSVTDNEGRFKLSNMPEGEVTLRVARSGGTPKIVTIEVPSDSYDITLD